MPESSGAKETCWPDHKDCDHREYIGKEVTLNNLPATVISGKHGNAWIKPLDPTLRSATYGWVVVFDICDNHDGKFTSVFPLE